MSVPKLRRGRGAPEGSAAPSTTIEPCLECQEETAAGSVFYSDRLEIERKDGSRVYLCADCHARARAARSGKPLTEADLEAIGENGLMIGLGFFNV